MIQDSVAGIHLELARLEAEYERRDSVSIPPDRYSYFNEAALMHAQSLERHLLALLKRHNFTHLQEKRILDVGCGSGSHLRRFIEYGAVPANLYGIDLMADRVERAREKHPAINWWTGSAHALPYPDASFDLVMCFVLFSSILDESLRRRIADEVWRVLKPAGLILLHDFTYSNPRNPAVRGITRKRIEALFWHPGVRFDFRRITLAPPISHVLAPRTYWLAFMLEHLKLLNTHVIGVIRQK